MTYHLASVRLHSIGERSARFTDLVLDFTAPDPTASSGPADTVVWLRNGGGKSSVLSLFYALLLPRAIDFMGRSVKRTLTDYVDNGDTAHTIAVWHPAEAQTLDGQPDRVLVTGVVYEWAGLRRPAEAERARDQLDTTFYAFYALPGVLDPVRLPILDEAGSPRRRADYIDMIKQAASAHMRSADLVVTERQHEWTAALTSRQLDPSLFRTQKQMNHVEGGVEDLFKFSSAREFIDLLIDLTVAPDDAVNVADRLGSISSILATKPAKTAERNFCADAAGSLDHVAHAEARRAEAADEWDRAIQAAADLAAAFRATLAATSMEIERIDGGRGEIEDRKSKAGTEQSIAHDLIYLYEERAAQMRIADAEQASTQAQADVQNAVALAAAWTAAEHLAAKAEAEHLLAETRRQAATERQETAPLRRDHDEHAARLRNRLLTLSQDHSQQSATATGSAKAARVSVEEHRKAAQVARDAARIADRDGAEVTVMLNSLTDDLAIAVRDGILPTMNTDPAERDGTLAAQEDELGQTLTEVRERRAERPRIRSEMTGRLANLTGEHVRLDADLARVRAEHTRLAERSATIADLDRVKDLTEATDTTPVDLWAEQDTLTRRLADAIIDTDASLIRLEAAQIDDRRTLDVHARTGLLPTTLDAERVLAVLVAHDIVAETGWMHLCSSIPAGQLTNTLRDPHLARVGAGIVIRSEQADKATHALSAVNPTTTALVGVYTAQTVSALIDVPTRDDEWPLWTGLHHGLIDPTVADSTAGEITANAATYSTRRHELIRSRDADRKLLDDLVTFLAECPSGHLDGLRQRTAELESSLDGIGDELAVVTATLTSLDAEDEEDGRLERQLQTDIGRLGHTRVRLAGLIIRCASVPAWRDDLAAAEGRSRRATDEAEKAEDLASSALDRASGDESTAAIHARTAEAYVDEAAALVYLDGEPDITNDPAVALDEMRARFRHADQVWRARASQSVLAEREQTLNRTLADIGRRLAPISAETTTRATALLATNEGQTKQSRAVALTTAHQAEKVAISRKAGSDVVASSQRDVLKKIKARRADPPRRSLPVEPTSPEHADTIAAEQEAVGQSCFERRRQAEKELSELDARQEALRQRARTFDLLADGLPDPGARTVDPFRGSDADAQGERRQVTERLTTAQQQSTTTLSLRAQAVSALRTVASKYAAVTTPAKDRVLHDGDDVLAQHAIPLAEQLRLRAQMIDGELAEIGKDQEIVTESLARLVSSTFDTIRKAERYSRVDTQIGGWSGKQMLRIAFDAPASEADLRAYANRVIERRIATGVKPEGLPLLKDAVHEAAGSRGFKVKVLKPTLEMVATTEDITRLGKWSGGEKLTVCVALYCTIAALRAANAGRRDRSGGAFLLDNPIGRASHGSLVRLQRAVSAAHKVQLVYTTGVKDPDAVSQFPNVIRLDNRPGRTRNRRYIIADTASSGEPDSHDVTGVRVAHHEPPADAEQPDETPSSRLHP